jgi:hypothetical protein
MSTNYYVKVAIDEEELHFGKSSGGWVFTVRQHPDHGLFTLYDWMALLTSPYNTVSDEYGNVIAVIDLLNVVINRTGTQRGPVTHGKTRGEGSWDYANYDFC